MKLDCDAGGASRGPLEVGGQPRAIHSAETVGAVVVNLDGGERVLRCLGALETQDLPLSAIVVVDNGSKDGSPGRIRAAFPRVRLVELGQNRGLPAARNRGLQEIGTDLALLVDADIYAEPDCVRHLVAAYHEHDAALVCPRILLLPEQETIQADGATPHFVGTLVLRHGYCPVDQVPAETAWVGGCLGGCILMGRRALLDAGGFDELYFFHFEDLELSLRLRSFGLRLLCHPAARVFHDRSTGMPGLSFRGQGSYPAERAYLIMRHRLLTILVHYRLRTILLLGPALGIYDLASLCKALAGGWARQWFRAWFWQLSHARLILERRERYRRLRVTRDRDLLVGGPLPLAPGVVATDAARRLVSVLTAVINGYWRLARRWIG